MLLRRAFRSLLLLSLLTTFWSGQAEPFRPLLSPRTLDSLHARLQLSRPDTARVQLLLLLSQDLIARHNELDASLNGAEPYALQAQRLSAALHYQRGQIGSLYVLGQLYRLIRLLPDSSGLALVRQGIVLSHRLAQKPLEAMGWYYLGESCARTAGELPAKTRCYQQARQLFRELGDRAHEAYLLKCVADMHLLQGQTLQALNELKQVVTLYRAAGYQRLHYTYDLLLAANRQMGNYKEALRYALASVESAQATGDTASIGGFYSRTAAVYSELQQYPQAMAYYHKALRNYQAGPEAAQAVITAGAMARILIAQGHAQEALRFFTRTTQRYAAGPPATAIRVAMGLAEINMALGNYALAARHNQPLRVFVARDDADDISKIGICQHLGKFALVVHRYDEARQYLQQSLQLAQRTGFLLKVAELHLQLFRADSAQSRYPDAIAHYQRYQLLRDSIFNETKTKQLAALQIQYDTRQKEQNIALLTKQTQVQQAHLRQREWQRNTLLVGAGMLLLLLGLGYNRYRLKQRSNRLLEAQQQEINRKNQALEGLLGEKEWMLKEIHHRVKNNLQVISSLLATQADYLADEQAAAAIRESQNRVQTMALIHQRLYQTDNLARVPMPEYLRDIVDNLLESFDRCDTVRAELQVDDIGLDVALATPIGLIINEAVTNTLKHGLPSPHRGTIQVSLTHCHNYHYELRIADNGVGFPPSFDPDHSHSLGLTMIKGLSRQIDGKLRITHEDGVSIMLQFAEPQREPARALSQTTG